MSDTPTTEPTSTEPTPSEPTTTESTTPTEPGSTETARRLREAQDKGYAGTDAADEAGGIEALRTKHREATVRDADNTGAFEPETPGGHPNDPTVSKSVGGGATTPSGA